MKKMVSNSVYCLEFVTSMLVNIENNVHSIQYNVFIEIVLEVSDVTGVVDSLILHFAKR